jgi:outer membrane immunogenic protein
MAGIGYDVNTGGRLVVGAEAELSDSSARRDNNNGVLNTFNLGRVKADRISTSARASAMSCRAHHDLCQGRLYQRAL